MDNWNCFIVVLKLCIHHNGLIYGGAVRDLMLHNIHAKEFLKTHRNADYADETIRPETLGRLLIPKDIDCLINEHDSNVLLPYLMHHYFLKVKEVNNVYFNNKNYRHLKLSVLFHKKSICVQVDLIIQKPLGELKMPCTNLDIDVNGLVMYSGGIGLSEYLRKGCPILNADTFQTILDNIRQKKAVAIAGCPSYRFYKMHKYGWDIQFTSTIFQYYMGEPYDGECIICKDKIPDDLCCVKYKECRCDLRMCLKCMLEHYTKLKKCPQCSEICYKEYDAFRDLIILKIKYPPNIVA
jgi:hypothetical protein